MHNRIFKKLALALVILAAAFTAKAEVKYVFYFIGDGMGMAQAINTNLYRMDALHAEPVLMTQFPHMTMSTTHSASSRVTDSAAAGTALATGHKTKNSMLGMGPDTTAVHSVAKALHDKGFGVGLVTSVAIDDATPGAFYTHVPHRNNFYDTGRYLAECGYEFMAGSGLRGTKDKDGKDNGLLDYIKSKGVNISYGVDGIDKEAQRVLVLSPLDPTSNEIGYVIDSIPGAATLTGYTAAAMEHLQRVSPEKFFLMVEGGAIDHAAHANDGGTVVREVIGFNDALQLAYDFYVKHPQETLIVVTADHETGGMSIGNAATGYAAPAYKAAKQKISKNEFNNYCRALLDDNQEHTWEQMQAYLKDNFGFWGRVKMNPDETESLQKMFNDIFEQRKTVGDTSTLYASFNGFANRVFDILNYKSGFGWTTPHHTGMPVPVYAVGVGADRFNHLIDNTDIPKIIYNITTGGNLIEDLK